MKRIFKWLSVFLFFSDRGVYSDRDEVSVSVNEGDSVTLHTGVQTKQQEEIKWYINDTRIAQITGDLSYNCTDVQCNTGTERFRDRLKLDHQTGSLTIINTKTTDSGDYELLLFSSSSSEKIFNVTVRGVSAAEQYNMKTISVNKGEYVSLDPDEVKDPNDVMTWYFDDTIIAKITGDPKKTTDVQCEDGNERFRGRLMVSQTGSLTITNTRTTDSGPYKLQITSNNSSFSISRVKRFSVSVIGEIAGISAAIGGGVLLVAAAGVIYQCCH
ncbi:uncharacterized protein LOC125263508 [Megalobrama amblycephala]|uniref:uncharacterized protein LOC125263508 n=1 Tax=Megalobrama amblycephala TaxID=75352 RepID=UPI0020142378|nr:uncharacterized protein LOC125263508 [Megalobrama amblycephala]